MKEIDDYIHSLNLCNGDVNNYITPRKLGRNSLVRSLSSVVNVYKKCYDALEKYKTFAELNDFCPLVFYIYHLDSLNNKSIENYSKLVKSGLDISMIATRSLDVYSLKNIRALNGNMINHLKSMNNILNEMEEKSKKDLEESLN